jgi:peptidyl-prolyl cis-trans isomerase SurA
VDPDPAGIRDGFDLESEAAMPRLFMFFVAVTLTIGSQTSIAQQVQRIAAIVNDDVISLYDLQSRMRLVIVSSRLPDNANIRRRIAPQVLRSLIDERLQMQEAKRRNVSVTKRDMDRSVTSIERRNKVAKGGFDKFLAKSGVAAQTVRDQIRANIAWAKLVRRRLRPRVSVGPDEVDQELDRLKRNRGKREYRLAEIFLSVDKPNDEDRVRKTAEGLVEQIRKGARFGALARQFSRSATAAVAGDLGWVPATDLAPELRNIVPKMKVRSVAGPIKTLNGFRIITLARTRKNAAPDNSQIKVDLKQIFLPFPKNADPSEVKSQIDLAKTVRETVSGCQDMIALSREVASPRPSDLGKFSLAELSPGIRNAVMELDIGQASQPVRMPGGFLLLMVCERNEPKVKLPSRNEINDRLTRQRLDMMSRRYLRDVRNRAVVDVRV